MFKLVPLRPLRQVRKLGHSASSQDAFDQFFDSFFNDDTLSSLSKLQVTSNSFLVDIGEDDDKYVVVAELAGFAKQDVAVEYRDKQLVIAAQRSVVADDESLKCIRRERCYGQFRRSFYVDNIDPDRIVANFDNGILHITLYKAAAMGAAQQIKID